MEINSTIKAHMNGLLADPATTGPADEALLAGLVDAYPYFKPAHLLLARATGDKKAIEKAALYSNGQLCYAILHAVRNHGITEVAEAEAEGSGAAARSLQSTTQDDQEIFEEIAEFDGAGFDQAVTPGSTAATEAETEPAPVLHWELSGSTEIPDAPEIETVTPDEPEHAHVSKYDDDKLPYTFLWWLARTRAAYQPVFQPYAAPKIAQSESGPLQQQYVEHIFHLQTGLTDANETAAATEYKPVHKEEAIINAFIEKDPQIKPPPVDRLDNENKARKSAEDHNDVVSETLAAIYIEQMLYRKAIDTYEKLSLKFPEKSRYFADLIKSLEKKI